MPKAAIDIGSNSILLAVVDDAGHVLHDEARVVGLGKGLGDRGLFAPDRMAAASETLQDYVRLAKAHGVDAMSIRAAATSAARRAMNAQTFFDRVKRDLGLRVQIVPGEEEARLTWLGTLQDLELPEGRRLVVDLGGGSTELVLGEGLEIAHRASLEIGSVRLTERFLVEDEAGRYDAAGHEPLQDYVDAELQRFLLHDPVAAVIGTAGTVTTFAALALELTEYDGSRVHGSSLTRPQLQGFAEELIGLDRETRRARVAVAPDRADWLFAGAVVLDRVLRAADAEALVVSDRGLRYGLLAD